MKIKNMQNLLLGFGFICACTGSAFAGTYANINIDGTFSDWASVPLAYTAPPGPTNAIQLENVYLANDVNNLYIRFTLYSPRSDAFANAYDNLFIDTDNNASTGFAVAGIGSEMLIQWGGGYQEKNGGFNEGGINNLGWSISGSPDSMDFELAISRNATYASDNSLVFANNTIAVLLEGDDTTYTSVEFVPASGGLSYTFAAVPEPSTFALAGLGLLLMTSKLGRGRRNR